MHSRRERLFFINQFLFQVLRQIQLWTRQLESDSDDDELSAQSEDHRYLSNIVAELVIAFLRKRIIYELTISAVDKCMLIFSRDSFCL